MQAQLGSMILLSRPCGTKEEGNGERKKMMMRLCISAEAWDCVSVLCQCMVLSVNSVEMMRDRLG